MNSLPSTPRKIKIVMTMLLVLIAAIWFALNSQPVQPVRRVSPDLVIQPISLDQALDLSLAVGDGRRVDWNGVR